MHVSMLLLYLTAVLSVSFSDPGRISLRGIWFALNSATYKIGFPGWPEPILDSVTCFWGVNYEKGACTSPLFHFRRPLGGRPRNDRFTVANETTNRGS